MSNSSTTTDSFPRVVSVVNEKCAVAGVAAVTGTAPEQRAYAASGVVTLTRRLFLEFYIAKFQGLRETVN